MVEFTQKSQYDIQDLVHIVELLRGPGGCPWDKEQTHASLRMALVEETYEVLEAIDRQDSELLCEELGDILLHVVMHSRMEAEQGRFTFDDVCDGVSKKMVFRHPHVFGGQTAANTGDVINTWEMLKNKEKARNTAAQDLQSVPDCLPALMRAAKLQKRAARYGIAQQELAQTLEALGQSVTQLRQRLEAGAPAEDAVGQLLFCAVDTARMAGVDAEEALTGASDRFSARVAACEELARQRGKALQQLTDAELDELWMQAK